MASIVKGFNYRLDWTDASSIDDINTKSRGLWINADEIIETLFKNQKSLEAAITTVLASVPDVVVSTIGTTNRPMPFDGQDGEDGMPGPVGPQGLCGIAGTPGQGIPGFDGNDGEDLIGPIIAIPQGIVYLPGGITGTLDVGHGGTGTATTFTQGSVVFAGASGIYSQNNSKLFWDNTNFRLGIGTTGPTTELDVNGAFHMRGSNGNAIGGASSSSYILRLYNPASTSTMMYLGHTYTPGGSGDGGRALWVDTNWTFAAGDAGTIFRSADFTSAGNGGAIALSSARNVSMSGPSAVPTGTTTAATLFLGNPPVGANANYSLWVNVGPTVIQGNTSFGDTASAPVAGTAKVHIAAGTAAASTAPLKFTSGTLLTSTEAGAIEFLTDDAYLTITTGAARKQIILNNSATAFTTGSVPFATTNGRLTQDNSNFYWDGTRLGLGAGTSPTRGGIDIRTAVGLTTPPIAAGNTSAVGLGTTAELFRFYCNSNTSGMFLECINAGDATEFNLLSTLGSNKPLYMTPMKITVGDSQFAPTRALTANFADNISQGGIALRNRNVGTPQTFGVAVNDSGVFYVRDDTATAIRLRIELGGQVGVGASAPTAMLHLPAGTATASTAPIKLTAGTVLGTPEAGTIEYDGTDFFLTP